MLTWIEHPKPHVVIYTPPFHGRPEEPACERAGALELLVVWTLAGVASWMLAFGAYEAAAMAWRVARAVVCSGLVAL